MYLSPKLAAFNQECTNEKCLTKANIWLNMFGLMPDKLYYKYVYNDWLAEMSESNWCVFLLFVAHSEYDK